VTGFSGGTACAACVQEHHTARARSKVAGKVRQGQLTEVEGEEQVQQALARAMSLPALGREVVRVSQRLEEMEREAGGSTEVLEMEVGASEAAWGLLRCYRRLPDYVCPLD
jgi:hypothetical protein